MDLSFIGDIVDGVDDIVYAFDSDARKDQVAIAQAQAEAARASASQASAKPISNTIIWGAVITAIVVIALVYFLRKK